MASKTASKDIITLRGSAAIVSEFFGYAVNRLDNRGVYPEESFVRVKKYGLPMLLTQDEGVESSRTEVGGWEATTGSSRDDEQPVRSSRGGTSASRQILKL